MIEIISIHIPKTGGSSFFELLRKNYGDIYTFHYRNLNYFAFQNHEKEIFNHLPEYIKVIHGHFHFSKIKHLKSSSTKIIAWMRNPMKRVVSRYLFLKKNISLDPLLHPKRDRADETLIQFAQRESQRNVQYKFLKGIQLQDLYFLGLQESYDQDVKDLAIKLNWKNIDTYNKNDNTYFKQSFSFSEEDLEKVKILNSLDIELYKQALSLKKNNIH